MKAARAWGAASVPSVTRIQRPVVLSSETGLKNVLGARCVSVEGSISRRIRRAQQCTAAGLDALAWRCSDSCGSHLVRSGQGGSDALQKALSAARSRWRCRRQCVGVCNHQRGFGCVRREDSASQRTSAQPERDGWRRPRLVTGSAFPSGEAVKPHLDHPDRRDVPDREIHGIRNEAEPVSFLVKV